MLYLLLCTPLCSTYHNMSMHGHSWTPVDLPSSPVLYKPYCLEDKALSLSSCVLHCHLDIAHPVYLISLFLINLTLLSKSAFNPVKSYHLWTILVFLCLNPGLCLKDPTNRTLLGVPLHQVLTLGMSKVVMVKIWKSGTVRQEKT